jgi:hypothetical protein
MNQTATIPTPHAGCGEDIAEAFGLNKLPAELVTIVPRHSPWGAIDDHKILAWGIVSVGTPSHGGIYLSEERQRMLPAWARKIPASYCPKPTWWEEDCEAVVPLFCFYEELPEEMRGRLSKAQLLTWIKQNAYFFPKEEGNR